MLHALSEGMPAEEFGRVSHLPQAQLAAVVDGMRARGLIGADGWLTAAGRQIKERIESLTDELAAPAYDILEPDELDQLVDDLQPTVEDPEGGAEVDAVRTGGRSTGRSPGRETTPCRICSPIMALPRRVAARRARLAIARPSRAVAKSMANVVPGRRTWANCTQEVAQDARFGKYVVTPSHMKCVATAASSPELASTASTRTCPMSNPTPRTAVASTSRSASRRRLSDEVSGWATSKNATWGCRKRTGRPS